MIWAFLSPVFYFLLQLTCKSFWERKLREEFIESQGIKKIQRERKKMIRTLERVTYLAPFLLPENGRWRVSFGLTSERHIFSKGYYLVLGLNHKLGWDWEGEKEKGAGIQWYLAEQASIVSLPPEVSSDPPVLPFLSILLQHPPLYWPCNLSQENPSP